MIDFMIEKTGEIKGKSKNREIKEKKSKVKIRRYVNIIKNIYFFWGCQVVGVEDVFGVWWSIFAF
jgi:hypothetical protein